MFSKNQLLASLITLPLAVHAICNIEFYSVSDCSGTPDASCEPDTTSSGRCYWNTWVGSAHYTCPPTDSPDFVGCDGSSEACDNAWSIALPDATSGCVDIGTYDGFVDDYDNVDPDCPDCVAA